MSWLTRLWFEWQFRRVLERTPLEVQVEDFELLFACACAFLDCPLSKKGNLYVPENQHTDNLPSDVVLALIKSPDVYQQEAERAYKENRDFPTLAQIPFTKEYWIRRFVHEKKRMDAQKLGIPDNCDCVVDRILSRFDEVRRSKVVSH